MKQTDPRSDDDLMQRLQRAVMTLPDVPPALERAALALFPATPLPLVPLVHVAGAALRRLAAVLSFDSWATTGLALGMRSQPSSTRHLLYSAQGRDIDLRVWPAAEAFALAGQILGPDEQGEVDLVRVGPGDATTLHARLDDLGEFRIDGVAAGTWALTLTLGGDRIELPPLEVGACRA